MLKLSEPFWLHISEIHLPTTHTQKLLHSDLYIKIYASPHFIAVRECVCVCVTTGFIRNRGIRENLEKSGHLKLAQNVRELRKNQDTFLKQIRRLFEYFKNQY
uniref:Uncharacterized protein n=1 Tax=Cacopsylla melanoneura TaxID=428564 RepID=A0A8D8WNL9_9HEMI